MYIRKPIGQGFNPFAESYINRVPEGDPVELLRDQGREYHTLYVSHNRHKQRR